MPNVNNTGKMKGASDRYERYSGSNKAFYDQHRAAEQKREAEQKRASTPSTQQNNISSTRASSSQGSSQGTGK